VLTGHVLAPFFPRKASSTLSIANSFAGHVSGIVLQLPTGLCNTCVRARVYADGCFSPQRSNRVIAFTFYQKEGNEPREQDKLGILHNIRMMRIVYPGWRMRLYIRYDAFKLS
jgi:hypothetical protein